MSTNKRKDVLWRVWLSFIGVCLFGLAVLGKTFHTQTFEGEYWKSLADSMTIFTKTLDPERGNIYSEDGRLLATSLPFFELRMDLNAKGLTRDIFNQNIDSLSICMANLFQDKTKSQYRAELVNARKDGNRYYLLKNNVSYPQLKAIKNFPLFRLGRNKSGLIVIQRDKRVMPFGELAQRTIGYIRNEGKYKAGIEGSYDEELNGVEGQILVQKLAGGTLVPVNSEDDIDPQAGHDIYTTIDINLQDVAETALYKSLADHDADWGTCVLMEVKTGKIKAMANLARNNDTTYSEQENFALRQGVEPGSTFKLASMIALLEEGLVSINDSVDLEQGTHKYFDRTMHDSEEHGLNKVSVKYAFAISSNVGISKLVYKQFKGREKEYYDHLCKLHLNEKTGIDIKGEIEPKVKKPEKYSGVSLPWISVGYEQMITPLQMLCFYNAIANNGAYVKPYVVSEIKEFNATIKKFEPLVNKDTMVSMTIMPKVKELLVSVCREGTGRYFSKGAPYSIAGKTGTTKLLKDGKYEGGYNASFIGYFPAENPQYSCVVVVSNPKRNGYYGGVVAGPVFREVADKVYAASLNIHPAVNKSKPADSLVAQQPLVRFGKKDEVEALYAALKIPFENEAQGAWITCQRNGTAMRAADANVPNDKVADVRGMGLKDAVYFLEKQGLKVNINGHGKVRQQSLAPGSVFAKGSIIELTLGS